jgi:hypothetical protein
VLDSATAKRCLTVLSFAFGHEINGDRLNALYTVLRAGEWTIAEMELASALIPTVDELCKRVSYDRTIGPGLFAMARDRAEVMRGRLHDQDTALRLTRAANVPLSDGFEAVYVEGDDTPCWRML